MWEAIASNRRRSRILLFMMGVILAALGLGIGATLVPTVEAGLIGLGLALVVWFVLVLGARYSGDALLLHSTRAHRIEKPEAPRLWNVVEEMTIAAGLAQMPKVYIIDEESPNAFAVGRSPEKASVAVTSGLLRRLDRDELQGVVAHELGHIRNQDIKFMTQAGVLLGAVVLLSDGFLRGLIFGAGARRRSTAGRGGGQAQIAILAVTIALAILGPIMAQMLYFACSRRREYLADASAARFTRYPAGLASALRKIARRASLMGTKNRAVAPMYIVNPLQGVAAMNLFSTHPPTQQRIEILMAMGGNAGLTDYEAAFAKVNPGAHCIGTQTLQADESVPARQPSPADRKRDAIERAREASDLIDGMARFMFIACACGVRIKVPPQLEREHIPCPRCGRNHELPSAEESEALAAFAGATVAGHMMGRGLDRAGGGENRAEPAEPPKGPMRYRRKKPGWESFKCRCGNTVSLSPIFSGNNIKCPGCGTRIEIQTSDPAA